jgi:hypothetical protein
MFLFLAALPLALGATPFAVKGDATKLGNELSITSAEPTKKLCVGWGIKENSPTQQSCAIPDKYGTAELTIPNKETLIEVFSEKSAQRFAIYTPKEGLGELEIDPDPSGIERGRDVIASLGECQQTAYRSAYLLVDLSNSMLRRANFRDDDDDRNRLDLVRAATADLVAQLPPDRIHVGFGTYARSFRRNIDPQPLTDAHRAQMIAGLTSLQSSPVDVWNGDTNLYDGLFGSAAVLNDVRPPDPFVLVYTDGDTCSHVIHQNALVRDCSAVQEAAELLQDWGIAVGVVGPAEVLEEMRDIATVLPDGSQIVVPIEDQNYTESLEDGFREITDYLCEPPIEVWIEADGKPISDWSTSNFWHVRAKDRYLPFPKDYEVRFEATNGAQVGPTQRIRLGGSDWRDSMDKITIATPRVLDEDNTTVTVYVTEVGEPDQIVVEETVVLEMAD